MMNRPRAQLTDLYLSRIVTYIPVEIIAAYVTTSGFISSLPGRPFIYSCVVSIALLVLTPFYIHYLHRSPHHPVASMLAFAAWVFAIGGPFAQFQMGSDGSGGWYHPAIGSVVLVLVYLCLPLIELGLTRMGSVAKT
jgi:hypothetical protein